MPRLSPSTPRLQAHLPHTAVFHTEGGTRLQSRGSVGQCLPCVLLTSVLFTSMCLTHVCTRSAAGVKTCPSRNPVAGLWDVVTLTFASLSSGHEVTVLHQNRSSSRFCLCD